MNFNFCQVNNAVISDNSPLKSPSPFRPSPPSSFPPLHSLSVHTPSQSTRSSPARIPSASQIPLLSPQPTTPHSPPHSPPHQTASTPAPDSPARGISPVPQFPVPCSSPSCS